MPQKVQGAFGYNVRDYWVGIGVSSGILVTTTEVGSITLPENSVVDRAFAIVSQQAVNATGTTQIAAGSSASDPDAYIEEADWEGAVDTVYGDAVAEIGTDIKETTEGATFKFIAAGGYFKVYSIIGTAAPSVEGKAMVYVHILELDGL